MAGAALSRRAREYAVLVTAFAFNEPVRALKGKAGFQVIFDFERRRRRKSRHDQKGNRKQARKNQFKGCWQAFTGSRRQQTPAPDRSAVLPSQTSALRHMQSSLTAMRSTPTQPPDKYFAKL